MIVRYLARSLQAAEEEFGGDKASPELKETLAYLGALEQLKTEKDVAVAVGLIEEYKFHPKQVAPHLQQFAQVWSFTSDRCYATEDIIHDIVRNLALLLNGIYSQFCQDFHGGSSMSVCLYHFKESILEHLVTCICISDGRVHTNLYHEIIKIYCIFSFIFMH